MYITALTPLSALQPTAHKEQSLVAAITATGRVALCPLPRLPHIPQERGGLWPSPALYPCCGPGDTIQLPDNLAQACDPLTPQPSCYQLPLTHTHTDAIILLHRVYWHRGFKLGPWPHSFQSVCSQSLMTGPLTNALKVERCGSAQQTLAHLQLTQAFCCDPNQQSLD